MGREIERKFLVRGEGWQKGASGILCRQGYLSRDPQRTVRVRIIGGRAYLAVKGATEGISRAEFEYPVPVFDAEAMLDLCLRPFVEKRRYRVEHEGFVWEVDEFFGENRGLVLAEVELPAEDCPLPIPDWVGREVSGDPRYFNSNLIAEPYARWSHEQG